MFEICKDRSHVSARKELIRRLMISFNEPIVAAPSHSAQRSQAYMAALKDGQEFAVYIYLYLTIERTGILYRYTDRIKSDEEFRAAEEDGLHFMEAMGFIVDDANFESLDVSEQERLLASIPLFTPPAVVAEVVEEKPLKEEEVREAVVSVTGKVDAVIEEKQAEEEIAVIEEVVKEAVSAATKIEAVKALGKPALAEEKVWSENMAAEESEGKWVPELSLSKFRMRVAAERMNKHN